VNPWKPILAALIIFATGVITGGVLVSYADRMSQKHHHVASREPQRPPNPGPPFNARDSQGQPRPFNGQLANRLPRILSEEFVRKLETEIELTAAQRERVHEIITAGQARNKDIWDRITPELRREMVETQKRIREILTADQLIKFEEFIKQPRPNRRKIDDGGAASKRASE
jgi:hypothetical protein